MSTPRDPKTGWVDMDAYPATADPVDAGPSWLASGLPPIEFETGPSIDVDAIIESAMTMPEQPFETAAFEAWDDVDPLDSVDDQTPWDDTALVDGRVDRNDLAPENESDDHLDETDGDLDGDPLDD